MQYKTHKDSSPENTIKNITDILIDIGIFTYETNWQNYMQECYSLSIKADRLNYKTNGKGVSKILALASGYGEFMERLQAGVFVTSSYGLMPDKFSFVTDEVETDIKEVLRDHRFFFEEISQVDIKEIENDLQKSDKKIIKYPYYNVFEKRVEYLPESLILLGCTTSGFSSGNTKEEALCQGICELFERHSLREIVVNERKAPNIPREEIEKLEIYSIIRDIENKGFHVIVKDCTLGGRLPVIGVVIINKERNKCQVKLGSDPIFQVALQRCLTEIFQLASEKIFNRRWKKIDFALKLNEEEKRREYEALCVGFSHRVKFGPISLLFPSDRSDNYKMAFESKFTDHKTSLHWLVEIIKKERWKLYARDMSYLGFPAFRSYIHGISTVFRHNKPAIELLLLHKNFLRGFFLRLKSSSIEDIKKAIDILEPYVNAAYKDEMGVPHPVFGNFMGGIIVNPSNYGYLTDNYYLLSLLFFRIAKYKKAYKYLNLFLQDRDESLQNWDHYMCVLSYFKLKSDAGISVDDIKFNLEELFGISLAEKVINDLSDPENAFKHFNLPECGDCDNCAVRNNCRYEKWKDVANRLEKKAKENIIDQKSVSELFPYC